MQTATFEIRSAFGQVRAYPSNPSAQSLCSLAGSVTLLPQNINLITSLGFVCVTDAGVAIVPSDLY